MPFDCEHVARGCAHTREPHFLPKLKQSLQSVPAGLAIALVLFVGSYWGLHRAFYGPEGAPRHTAERATHSYNPDSPHGPMAPGGIGASTASGEHAGHAAMPAATDQSGGPATPAYEATMNEPMMQGMRHPYPDVAFMLGMIPHHQGAIDMARVQLQYGANAETKSFAEHVIAEQEAEIRQMRQWLERRGVR